MSAAKRKRPVLSPADAAAAAAAAEACFSKPASTQETNACAQMILQVCGNSQNGVGQEVIESELKGKFDQALMLKALNTLLSKGRLVSSMRANNKLVFKVQSIEEAQRLQGLTGEDRLILQEVEKAGNVGIATRELRMKANMQRACPHPHTRNTRTRTHAPARARTPTQNGCR